jgi:HEAT repeat protein
MSLADLFTRPGADIAHLVSERDLPALIRLLRHPDSGIRQLSCDALFAAGADAVPLLEKALYSQSAKVRLGAIQVLGRIGDAEVAASLLNIARTDKYLELRYSAIITLGEIGATESVTALVPFLQDPDKYLRHGAAGALSRRGWEPPDTESRIARDIALQDWDAVKAAGTAATGPLRKIMNDDDPVTRSRIAALLGRIGAGQGGPACQIGLKDRDPRVRWAAVLAAMDCGISPSWLPPYVAARKRTGPNPTAAALLNFLFLGIGYNYIGKWWGFPVFMTYMSLLVLAQLAIGPFLPYLIAYPVTAVLGLHTFYLARGMSDL